jgi:hypothetical protein
MTLVMIVLNVVLMAGLVAVIAGGLLYAVATQHRDHGAVASGSLLRRQVWSQRRRPQRDSVRPRLARQGEAWPST